MLPEKIEHWSQEIEDWGSDLEELESFMGAIKSPIEPGVAPLCLALPASFGSVPIISATIWILTSSFAYPSFLLWRDLVTTIDYGLSVWRKRGRGVMQIGE